MVAILLANFLHLLAPTNSLLPALTCFLSKTRPHSAFARIIILLQTARPALPLVSLSVGRVEFEVLDNSPMEPPLLPFGPKYVDTLFLDASLRPLLLLNSFPGKKY